MDIVVTLAGIRIKLCFCEEVVWEPWLDPFVRTDATASDLTVAFHRKETSLPSGVPLGNDLLQSYYAEGDLRLCIQKGGSHGPVAVTKYDSAFSHVVCTLGSAMRDCKPLILSVILRLLPMRAIFQHFGALFFHASQIQLGSRGIIFTGPSGIGKTTQAKLWREYAGADIRCNDRTLIRAGKTYGYLFDGDDPVRWAGEAELGALVLLEQGEENVIRRLAPGRAIAALMPQLVVDDWDPGCTAFALSGLVALVERYPVYRLRCTSDEGAVRCLERQLLTDGVIEHGEH